MKSRVYLAAPWVCKEEMKAVQDQWEAAGVEVTSHWIKHHPPATVVGYDPGKDPAVLREEAIQDLMDVDEADTLVLYPLAKSEGKATELGYAIGNGQRIIIVGEWKTVNVFFYLPEVECAANTETAIQMVLHP